MNLPAAIRNAINEWAAKGYRVKVDLRNGVLEVDPAPRVEDLDLVDWEKRK